MFSPPSSPKQLGKSSIKAKQYFDHKTNDSMTALHLFCRSGSKFNEIKLLVSLYPDLISCTTTNSGDTPLHFAVAAHDLPTVRLLVKANPAAASVRSSRHGNFGNRVTALHVAISSKASLDIVHALAQASPRSLKIRDGEGNTPMELALEHADGHSLQLILPCLRT